MAKIITAEYALELHYPPLDSMTDQELLHFCEQNNQVPIERDENHQILFLPPATSGYSVKKLDFLTDLVIWNRKLKSGLAFESSAGFFLPDTSMKSPDAAWISNERWNALGEDKRKGFAYVAPDFIVELASPSDNIAQLKNKMEKWRDNGVKLGWLINLKTETVLIYRIDGTISKVQGFANVLSGEDVLPGFEFGLSIFL